MPPKFVLSIQKTEPHIRYWNVATAWACGNCGNTQPPFVISLAVV